jgi:hypothetical protein
LIKQAVVMMDLDLVEETIEHTEAVYQLSASMRDVIMNQLGNDGDPDEALRELFNTAIAQEGRETLR